MAAYYHHIYGPTEISAAASDHLHHTLLLMNPNFADCQPPPPPSQPPNSVLFLNSATAAVVPDPPSPPYHQLLRPPPPHQESITLYGHPQAVAGDITRGRQGLSLSLSPTRLPRPPDADVDGDVSGGGQRLVLGSKYLKAAQELLEEAVHVSNNNELLSRRIGSPEKGAGPNRPIGELLEENRAGGGDDGCSGGGTGGAQLSTVERQELQMRKAKLVNILEEAEQRYRQYHCQTQTLIASFEEAAGNGSAKAYTTLALKTISKQFRCLKDTIKAQIKAVCKGLGEKVGSSAGKLDGSKLKYIDQQIRQQRALQQLGMLPNHNAWRPQRGLPEKSVSVLRAWLFEHFLHPYPKDSDKIILAKQAGLTRSQVSNWFINARVRLWKPMIEEMYVEEMKGQEQNGSEDKSSSNEISNESNLAINEKENKKVDQNQPTSSLKDQNIALSSSPSFISVPTNSTSVFEGNNKSLPQNQHGLAFTSPLQMEGTSQGSPKRPKNDEILRCGETYREIFIKFGNEKQGNDTGYPVISGAMDFAGAGQDSDSYPSLGEIGRFGEEFPGSRFLPGNGISLSLGLLPCENQQQQHFRLPAANHSFLTRGQTIQFRRANDFVSMSSASPLPSAAAFECIDIQNRKGFEAQLLSDFVA